ncbi:MAG: hypothetical protein PHR07_10345 [Acidaminococcaceae bacterium]|nr:hypothetical protein [Acidaminococcaceae bacterium]
MAFEMCDNKDCTSYEGDLAQLHIKNHCHMHINVTECSKYVPLFKPHKDALKNMPTQCENNKCSNYVANSSDQIVPNHCGIFTDISECKNKITNDKENVEMTAKGKFEYYTSPQTGSVYVIANSGAEAQVSYREVEPGAYRVRVQGEEKYLEYLTQKLTNAELWGPVKEGDHLSITVFADDFPDAVADAVRAVMRAGYIGVAPQE